jgi:hypothetical protein
VSSETSDGRLRLIVGVAKQLDDERLDPLSRRTRFLLVRRHEEQPVRAERAVRVVLSPPACSEP